MATITPFSFYRIHSLDRRLINLSIEFLETNDIYTFDINSYINPKLRENLLNRIKNKLLNNNTTNIPVSDWQSIKDL